MIFYPETFQETAGIIQKYDAVSFDIWDTLIMRRLMEPEHVFDVMERKTGIKNFANVRRTAVLESPIANPNIHEIYGCIQEVLNISDQQREELLQLEINIEKKIVAPRKSMVQLMTQACHAGKKVTLITDMYLPCNIMREILATAGINEDIPLYVSCDYRKLKSEGLFLEYKNQIEAERYLHIGDNPKSDIQSAGMAAIDSIQIASALRQLEKSLFRKIIPLGRTSVNSSIYTGMFMAEIFNDPFGLKGKITVDDAVCAARLFVAPLITAFMNWMIIELQKDHYDKVLFAARDGFLMQKVYRAFKDKSGKNILPEDCYFLASRQVCTIASIAGRRDVEWLSLVNFRGTPEELLSERFRLKTDEILPYDKERYSGLTEYVLAHYDKILIRSSEVKNGYLKYMQECEIRPDRKYALFDFVSSGTCQYHLMRFFPFHLTGKYFCHSVTDDEKKSLEIDGFFVNNGVAQADTYFYKNYKFIEMLMTSTAPSIVGFTQQAEPCFTKDTRTDAELNFVRCAHDSIMQYVGDFLELSDGKSDARERKTAELIYQFMDGYYTDLGNTIWMKMQLVDDWGREKVNINFEEDSEILNYIDQHPDGIYDDVLIRNDSWELFDSFSEMRKSVLNWYDFKEDSSLLEINPGSGAITGLFCDSCGEVISIADDLEQIKILNKRYGKRNNFTISSGAEELIGKKKFDYIVIEGIVTGRELEAAVLLKEDGHLLLMAENSEGSKYRCGYPRPKSEMLFSKEQIRALIMQSGLPFMKFYYLLPDYRLTQEIYTDERLPQGSIKDRVLFYYPVSNALRKDEHKYCDHMISQGRFCEVVNSYLVEAGKIEDFDGAEYVALSADRRRDHAFATVIEKEKVIKKALYPEGVEALRDSYNNICRLKKRKLSVVEHCLENDVLVMPFFEGARAVDWLYKAGCKNIENFVRNLDKFIECISRSSAISGEGILENGYIDMVPMNCFVRDNRYYFYDQEFKKKNCDIKYIIFRVLKYLYLSYPDLEQAVSLESLQKRYGISGQWEYFLKKEDEFIYEIRNHKVNHSFYRWVENGRVDKSRIYCVKGVQLVSGYDAFEFDGEQVWSWALDRRTALVIENGGEDTEKELFCLILPPPGLEKQNISVNVQGSRRLEFTAPIELKIPLSLNPYECREVVIESKGCMTSAGNGDPRKFSFQLRNPQVIDC